MADTISTVKVKRQKLAIFALLLSFAALCASGVLYYQGMKAHAHITYELSSLDNLSKTNDTQTEGNLSTINNQLNVLKNKVDSLKTDKFSANNYQINTLVGLATEGLVIYHDVNSAIKLLSYARDIIDASNLALYTELKVALTTDIDRLKQTPVIDRVVIATKLNNIIANSDNLALVVNNEPEASNVVSNKSDSKWNLFLTDIKVRILGLVQISSANNSKALNLLPQNRAIIHQNLKLDILNARMALLQNDESNWQYSLKSARKSLESYFISNSSINNVMDEVDRLQKINISSSDIDIDRTLKALNKLNNLEK